MQWVLRLSARRLYTFNPPALCLGWRRPPPPCYRVTSTLCRRHESASTVGAEEVSTLATPVAESNIQPPLRAVAVEHAALPPVDYTQIGGEATAAAGRVRLASWWATPNSLCSACHARHVSRRLGGAVAFPHRL